MAPSQLPRAWTTGLDGRVSMGSRGHIVGWGQHLNRSLDLIPPRVVFPPPFSFLSPSPHYASSNLECLAVPSTLRVWVASSVAVAARASGDSGGALSLFPVMLQEEL